MKTKLLKNFAILSLGLMGLFLIGNNLYAVDDDLGVVIECNASCPGKCWLPSQFEFYCWWTGLTRDYCGLSNCLK